jgi:hypothetical protein
VIRFASRCCGLVARPSRDVAPAGDLLFAPPKSRQKALPCKTAPVGVPCDARSPGPRPTHFATLRSDKGARSQKLKRASLAPWASALLGGLEGEAPNSQPQQPTAKPGSRLSPAVHHTPFEPAEERRSLRPRAQRASRTDSAQLFEQSAAARVLRGAASSEHRRAARCEAKGRAVRGRLFAFFLVAQKEGRPPGRRPGMGRPTKQVLPRHKRFKQET